MGSEVIETPYHGLRVHFIAAYDNYPKQLTMMDLNHQHQIQILACYHYTNGHQTMGLVGFEPTTRSLTVGA